MLGDHVQRGRRVVGERRGQALVRNDLPGPVAERERGLGAADVDAEEERDGVLRRAT